LGSAPCVHTENIRMNKSATQKYGNADVTTNTDGKTESSLPPRRQPATMPTNDPSTNASTVVTPTRPSVHGSAWPTMVLTGSPSVAPIDSPHCPVTMSFRYSTYCTNRFWWGWNPKDVSISDSALGDSLLWVRSR